jgi:arginyl-tRNA synthetase
MMSDDLFAHMHALVAAALRRIAPALGEDVLARVEMSATREAAHGDMATNAAMVAAKPAGMAPRALAASLAEELRALPEVAAAEAAGPGFVNLRLHDAVLRSILPVILRRQEAYGDSTIGNGVRVNVEYVSANPTGPMHIGHCRGAVVGDALANLLARAGFSVTKEFYVNDAGAQVDALGWAAYWRYLQALGTAMSEESFSGLVPGGLQYRGEYLIPVGEALAAKFGAALAAEGLVPAPREVWLAIVRDFAIGAMLVSIREDLALLGVAQDVFSSERRLRDSGAVDRAIDALSMRGLIYEGVLELPKGKTPEDWEPRKQTLFRSTGFGDDVDRPLRKSDGSNTYFANDIAYHADKIARGAEVLIDVLGADHGGYVKRMDAAVKALAGEAKVRFEAVMCQIVHVVRDGQPVKMSKRAGSYITLRDLIEEVGRDAVRFTMLTRKADAQMTFDLDAVVAATRENPVFYVNYAHARCRSVLRSAALLFEAAPLAAALAGEGPLEPLSDPAELALIRRLAQWPRTVEAAALAREPHRIAFFLYDLAGDFHMLWSLGGKAATLRFLQPDSVAASMARVSLVASVATVIRSGLGIMGVTPVEELR